MPKPTQPIVAMTAHMIKPRARILPETRYDEERDGSGNRDQGTKHQAVGGRPRLVVSGLIEEEQSEALNKPNPQSQPRHRGRIDRHVRLVTNPARPRRLTRRSRPGLRRLTTSIAAASRKP